MLSAARPDPYPLPGLAGSSLAISTAALHDSEYLLLMWPETAAAPRAGVETVISLQHW